MNKLRTILITASLTLLVTTIGFGYFYLNLKDSSPKQFQPGSGITVDSGQNNLHPVNLQKINQDLYKQRSNIITETIKNVSPAVVGINVTQIRQIRSPWANDPFFRHFFGDRVYNQTVKSLGSGAIISPDGYIITNDHVAGSGKEIIVTMTNGTRHKAEIVGTDLTTDICLLKIDGENLPYINFANNDDLIIGEWSIALGNPFGLFEINDKPTVTVGVISSTEMNLGLVENRYYLDMIQTDASINGGNSGGPLVNSVGELIGMNTIIYSPSGNQGSVGVGFAIPIRKIKKVITELKEDGKINRDFWTGLRIQNIDESIAKYYGLNTTRGVLITYVAPDSPAESAGLEVGDIVYRLGKYVINDDKIILGALQEYRTGETIEIEIIRDNKKYIKKLKLERQI